MKRKVWILALLAVMVCGSLFAGPGAQGDKKGKRVFGYTYWAASDFFTTIGQSIKEIAEKNGDEIIIVDAQQNNERQLNIIDDFITRKVDIVFLNPVDRDAIKPALLKLKSAKIPVVNFDTSVADLSLVDSYIASDNVGAGKVCAEALNKAFPNGGNIAILDYPANSACLDRTKGFMATINKNFKVVAQQDAQGKPDPGLEKATDILTANPNLVAIFCVNDQSGMGAYGAVVTAKRNVQIYGVDGAPESKEVISKGTVYAGTAAQSPKQIGVKCAEVAYNLLAGKPYDKEFYVPTFLIDINNAKNYLGSWQ
jgi:ribose transport system substrate-binding protein